LSYVIHFSSVAMMELTHRRFIVFFHSLQLVYPLVSLLTWHSAVLYILVFHPGSLSKEIRSGYIVNQIFLIIFEWTLCWTVRVYPLMPYPAIYCDGLILQIGSITTSGRYNSRSSCYSPQSGIRISTYDHAPKTDSLLRIACKDFKKDAEHDHDLVRRSLTYQRRRVRCFQHAYCEKRGNHKQTRTRVVERTRRAIPAVRRCWKPGKLCL
ncbi:hypothetical protein PMAYCL1PPCAC_15547, partial [Pristionchus mayeri]